MFVGVLKVTDDRSRIQVRTRKSKVRYGFEDPDFNVNSPFAYALVDKGTVIYIPLD